MELIKGATAELRATAYAIWTGLVTTSTPANVTGATIKGIFKARENDADASALFSVNGTIVDAVNGVVAVAISRADTVALSHGRIWYEIVVKLQDGTTYIRTGAKEMVLLPNVLKNAL